MTFEELANTLIGAAENGQVGTPVALRLHGRFSEPKAEPSAVLAAAIDLGDRLFGDSPARLMARGDTETQCMNALISYGGGATLFVTCGAADRPSLHALLIGNHGIARLEGAELFDGCPPQPNAKAAQWEVPLQRSLKEGCAVELCEDD